MRNQPSLDNCWAKIQRANENIANLDGEIHRFIDTKPYEFVPDKYHTSVNERWKQWRCVAVKEVPLRLGVLTGEVIHHLRSSLDLLTYQLILKNRRADPVHPTRVEFPVLVQKPQSPKQYKADITRKIQDVSLTAEARIESLQPYNCSDPANSPLFVVHDLNRIDKHRLILTMLSRLTYPEAFIEAQGRSETVNIEIRAVHDSLEVGAVIIDRIPSDPNMQMEPNFAFDITFGESGFVNGKSVVPTLNDLSGFVSDTLNSFAGEF